jgi:hypothetical protein
MIMITVTLFYIHYAFSHAAWHSLNNSIIYTVPRFRREGEIDPDC